MILQAINDDFLWQLYGGDAANLKVGVDLTKVEALKEAQGILEYLDSDKKSS